MTDPPPIIILIFYHLSSRKALRQQSERPGIRGLIFSISLVESLAPSVGASRDTRRRGRRSPGTVRGPGWSRGHRTRCSARSVVVRNDDYYSL